MQKTLLWLTALAVAPWTGSAFAQTNPPSAQAVAQDESASEVVVTARKRAERIQDVPAAISALSAAQIEDLGGLRGPGSFAALAPGVQFTNTGNLNAELNIRGSGAGTVRTANTDSPIAVLRDGASVVVGNIGGRTYARGDLFDVGRIEVIRGPQGVLYGQSTTGGVVNVISQAPKNTFEATAEATYNETVDEVGLQAILNIPLPDDRFAVRLGVQHENREDGFFQNVVTGRYGDINRYTGGRFAVSAELFDGLDALFIYDNSDEQGPSNRVKSVTLGQNDLDGPYLFGHNTRDRSDRELQSASFALNWTVPFGLVTLTNAWRSRETEFLQDEDGSAPGYARTPTGGANCALTRACETLFADDSELSSQEIRVDFSMPDTWSLLVGASYEQRENDFYTVARGRTTSATNSAPSPSANNTSVSDSSDEFVGLFGTLGWSPTSRLDLSVGARYTEIEKSFSTFSVRRNVGGVVTGALCNFESVIDVTYNLGCVTPGFIGELTDDNVSPAASVLFRLTENVRVFGNVAKGFRAGGFNANASLINAAPAPGQPTAPNTFSNETSNAYEVGIKAEAFGARFSASYYFNQIDDLIVTLNSTDTTSQTRNFRTNAGQAETRGVDLEIGGALDAPLLGGDFAYTAALNWCDGEYVNGPFQGKKVEGQPEWQTTLTGIYRRPINDAIGLFASANVRLQRGGLTAVAGNTNTVALDDFEQVDARIGLEFDRVRVTLESTNLLDDRTPTLRDGVTTAFPQGQRIVYGDPRAVLVRLNVKFGQERR